MSHLWGKKRQADEGQQHPEVLLSMLDVVPHPHHQSLEDRFLVGDIDVIAGEQLNDLSRGEQQELLVLNDLQEVFLEHRGDVEETDNHQSLAEGYAQRSSVCPSVCVPTHTRTKRWRQIDLSRQRTPI